MALNRKYSALPDLDTAPDIYETPDLTDDNSTVPTAAAQSEYDFDDEDTDAPGISRSKLQIDQARSRFLSSKVDASDADFSDRLDAKRRAYKISSRRILDDGTTQFGDLSEDEDSEDLARKIARLKREIEEAKEEYRRHQADNSNGVADHGEQLSSLSEALDEMKMVIHRTRPAPKLTTAKGSSETPEAVDGVTYSVTYAPEYEETHGLAKAADFDQRLMQLEAAIGVTAAAMPGLDGDRLPRAIVPTLDDLQKQLAVLSEASTSSLDSISRRVRELTKDAEQLEKSRKAAKAAQESLEASGVQTTEPTDEQAAKISALYGTLPAIESLAPLLPPLLDRLRSLRALHEHAAIASETLERIEQTQFEMASDITQWREGLERLEAAMKGNEDSIKANEDIIQGWVKELEAKMARLT